MNMVVAGLPHRVGIAAGPLNDERGNECSGRYLDAQRTILISPSCTPAARLSVLFHELRHAFILHAAGGELPSSLEADCHSAATFAATGIRWLQANGGEVALMKLQPGEFLQPGAARLGVGQGRTCPRCQTAIAGGGVEVQPDPVVIGRAILRAYCTFCERLLTWRETMGPAGLPNNDATEDPVFDGGEEMRAFLRRHGDSSEVTYAGTGGEVAGGRAARSERGAADHARGGAGGGAGAAAGADLERARGRWGCGCRCRTAGGSGRAWSWRRPAASRGCWGGRCGRR
jgi:hypothetical protein